MPIVEQYWTGVLQRLDAEVAVFSKLVTHEGERGRENEAAIEAGFATEAADREVLSRYLFGNPRVLMTEAEAKASARASGMAFDRWAEA